MTISNNETYNLGYNAFIEGIQLSPDDLKKTHPFYRRGYRTAQEEMSAKLHKGFPTVLYDIPKRVRRVSYSPSWDDIVSSTRRPRFNRLHSKRLEPILLMMLRVVDGKRDKIKSYDDVTRMMDKAFDIVLQYGFDEGILDEVDLKQYYYEPKKKGA